MTTKFDKYFISALLLAVGFFSGAIVGYQVARPRSIDDALRQAHEYIDNRLNSQFFPQTYLTIYSQYLLSLVYKRRFFLENDQPDSAAWQKKYEEEMEKPSAYEGGSAAPMDINLRGYYLQLERISEIKKREKNSAR